MVQSSFVIKLCASILSGVAVVAFLIGGAAALSGDLRNSDNIGGATGDVFGAGLFQGILGEQGLVAHLRTQQKIGANDTGTTNQVPKPGN